MIRIAVLGDRNLEYVTHRELDAALGLFPDWARGEWVATDSDVQGALDRAELCGTEPFAGVHWCNYGLSDDFVAAFLEAAAQPSTTPSI